MGELEGKDIIAIEDMSAEDIESIVEKAEIMSKRYYEGSRNTYEFNKRNIALLFYQASTRTHGTFEEATKQLGATTCGFLGTDGTSIEKGESIFLTVKMYEGARQADAIVMRHPLDGSVQWAADAADIPIINGGDGIHEHPTQALLDMYMLYREYGKLDNLEVCFLGDLKNGRTIHSDSWALSKFSGNKIHFTGPDFLRAPRHLVEGLKRRGVEVIEHDSLEQALDSMGEGVLYATRPQFNLDPSLSKTDVKRAFVPFKVTEKLMKKYPKIVIAHPLPIDRTNEEVELGVTLLPNQRYLSQAQGGTFTRKGILSEILPEEYFRFTGRYDGTSTLLDPNNQVSVQSSGKHTGKIYIDKIDNGVVIDHIESGKARKITQSLYGKLGYDALMPEIFTGELMRHPESGEPYKDILKIRGQELTSRMIKLIAMQSPDATFNEIEGGNISRKFKALICQNGNCVTRELYEDAPPKFYVAEEGTPVCHYCRSPHDFGLNVSDQERAEYLASLPRRY